MIRIAATSMTSTAGTKPTTCLARGPWRRRRSPARGGSRPRAAAICAIPPTGRAARPIVAPTDAYWIQAGRLGDQQAWVFDEMKKIAEQDRNFEYATRSPPRPTTSCARAERTPTASPWSSRLLPALPGAVLVAVERRPDTSLDALGDWLLDDYFGRHVRVTAPDARSVFTPRPKEPWWPAAAPEVEGVGDRLVVIVFTEIDPPRCGTSTSPASATSSRPPASAASSSPLPFIPRRRRHRHPRRPALVMVRQRLNSRWRGSPRPDAPRLVSQ